MKVARRGELTTVGPPGKAAREPECGLLGTPAAFGAITKRKKSGRHGKRIDAELIETVTMLAKDEPLPRRISITRTAASVSMTAIV
jgi:hypothetical protein